MTLPAVRAITQSVRRSIVTATVGSDSTAPNSGVVTLVSTSGNTSITLKAPKAGCELALIATDVGGGTITVNSDSTGTSFSSSGLNLMTFNAAEEAVILRGLSTTSWAVLSNRNSVGFGTQST